MAKIEVMLSHLGGNIWYLENHRIKAEDLKYVSVN